MAAILIHRAQSFPEFCFMLTLLSPSRHSPNRLLMRRAIYPGSFDPVTNGHLDIIARGCKLFDEIIIAVVVNPGKQPMFTLDERRAMVEEALAGLGGGACRLSV